MNPTRPSPPFCLMASLIVFSIDDEDICEARSASPMKQRVFAEMEIVTPYACIHITICTDGTPERVCPITKRAFKPGDPVYVMNSDVQNLQRGVAVPCIGANGIKKLGMEMRDSGVTYRPFKDPFGREPERNMWGKRDYTLYFIFDDTFLEQGICGQGPAAGTRAESERTELEGPGSSEQPRGGKARKRGGAAKRRKNKSAGESSSHSEAGPSSADSPDIYPQSPPVDIAGPSGLEPHSPSIITPGPTKAPLTESLMKAQIMGPSGLEPDTQIITTPEPTKSPLTDSMVQAQRRARKKALRRARGVPASFLSDSDEETNPGPSTSSDQRFPGFFDPTSERFQKMSILPPGPERQDSASSDSYRTADELLDNEPFLSASYVQSLTSGSMRATLAIFSLIGVILLFLWFQRIHQRAPDDCYVDFSDESHDLF